MMKLKGEHSETERRTQPHQAGTAAITTANGGRDDVRHPGVFQRPDLVDPQGRMGEDVLLRTPTFGREALQRTQVITCIRIYPSNHFTRFRTEKSDEVTRWVEHNKSIRPSAALIIDGEIKHKGVLTNEQIATRVAQIDLKPHYPWTEDPLRRGGSEEVR